MIETAIKAEHLAKSYKLGLSHSKDLRGAISNVFRRSNGKKDGSDTFWALNDISFTVNSGEAVGIIGKNGAGKSTLLKILSRITEPTKGRVELNGRVSSLLEVGTGFHPELTGRENIFLNGTILGMKRKEIKQKFDEIVEFSGVEQFVDTAVKHYSSGMKVRLAFSVAAHLEPEILLIDEVLAVGDIEFQKKCLGKMEDVTHQGRTILFVSHQMEAIRKFCKRCFLIDKGNLVEDSSNVESVIQSYINLAGERGQSPQWVSSKGSISNPIFKPEIIRINTDGSPAEGSVQNDADNEVVIIGEILEDDPYFEIGYAIYNQFGVPVYTTFFYDGPEDRWPKIGKGNVELHSKIPKRYLNEGIYKLELIAGIRKKTWYIGPGSTEISLNFEIQGGLSDSPIWHSKRQGVTAPVIEWYNK